MLSLASSELVIYGARRSYSWPWRYMATITYNYVSRATAAQPGAGARAIDVADETRHLQPSDHKYHQLRTKTKENTRIERKQDTQERAITIK